MPIVPILIAVVVIAGAVALYLSKANWRWYHITMVSLTMVLSVVWFYLAARTLKMQDAWRSEVNKWEQRVAAADKEHDLIVGGGPGANGKEHPALGATKLDLEKMLLGRGRLWGQRIGDAIISTVKRKSVDANTGQMVVTVEKPVPHGIEKNMILAVFEDGVGTQFLGEYEVTNAAANSVDVTLTPVLKLRKSEYQRIAGRNVVDLNLYEVMPADSHEFLAYAMELVPSERRDQFNDEKLVEALLPAEVRQEYLKDGKPAAAGEPQVDRVWRHVKAVKEFTVPLSPAEAKAIQDAGQTVEIDSETNKPVLKFPEGTPLELDARTAQEEISKGTVAPLVEEDQSSDRVYRRQLRDYATLYRDLNLQIEELLRVTDEVNRENAAIVDAEQKVDGDVKYRKNEKAACEKDLAQFKSERDLIMHHADALQMELTKVKDEADKTGKSNRELASELAMLMHQAVDFTKSHPAPPK